MSGGATLDRSGRYRYRLWRDVDELGASGRCLFVMLNPSIATADTDDHTITCCRRFTAREGYAVLDVVNLFALRSTDPGRLLEHPDPVGPCNDDFLHLAAAQADRVIVAWSALAPQLRWRVDPVLAILRRHHPELWCFGRTAAGFPRHPSRLPALAPLVRW